MRKNFRNRKRNTKKRIRTGKSMIALFGEQCGYFKFGHYLLLSTINEIFFSKKKLFYPRRLWLKINEGNVENIEKIIEGIPTIIFVTVEARKITSEIINAIKFLKEKNKIVDLVIEDINENYESLLNSGAYKISFEFPEIENFRKTIYSEDFKKFKIQIKEMIKTNKGNKIRIEAKFILKKRALPDIEKIIEQMNEINVEKVSFVCTSELNKDEQKMIRKKLLLSSKKYSPFTSFSFLPANLPNKFWKSLGIAADENGNIYRTKEQMYPNLTLGNLFKESFEEIWKRYN